MCTETARPPIFTDKDNLFCCAALYNWWGPGWTIKCWMWGWFTERSPYFKAFYFSNWRWSLFWDIWCFTVKDKYILYYTDILTNEFLERLAATVLLWSEWHSSIQGIGIEHPSCTSHIHHHGLSPVTFLSTGDSGLDTTKTWTKSLRSVFLD